VITFTNRAGSRVAGAGLPCGPGYGTVFYQYLSWVLSGSPAPGKRLERRRCGLAGNHAPAPGRLRWANRPGGVFTPAWIRSLIRIPWRLEGTPAFWYRTVWDVLKRRANVLGPLGRQVKFRAGSYWAPWQGTKRTRSQGGPPGFFFREPQGPQIPFSFWWDPNFLKGIIQALGRQGFSGPWDSHSWAWRKEKKRARKGPFWPIWGGIPLESGPQFLTGVSRGAAWNSGEFPFPTRGIWGPQGELFNPPRFGFFSPLRNL